jgi:hypothetical protein
LTKCIFIGCCCCCCIRREFCSDLFFQGRHWCNTFFILWLWVSYTYSTVWYIMKEVTRRVGQHQIYSCRL